MSMDGDAGPTAAKRGGVAQAGDVPGRAGGLDLAVIGNSRVGALVDTDMEEASARLQALQVQQQLATQALSIANQQPQNILALFR